MVGFTLMTDGMRYPVMVEAGDADTAYGVVVPDLPGCFSAGDSFDDAVSRAADAIALWIEDALEAGQLVPSPSPLEVLKMRLDGSMGHWVWAVADRPQR